jgi:hypothetical protein
MILSSCPSRLLVSSNHPSLSATTLDSPEGKTNVGRSCYSLTENLAGEIGKTSAAARAAAIDAQEQ